MIQKKKKFFETTVGRVLKGAASIVAPGLVNALENVKNVEEAVSVIRNSTEISDDAKFKLQDIALQQYEAEVADRIEARRREAQVAQAGGADLLFKFVGIGITLSFLGMVLTAMGVIDYDIENQRMWDVAFGAITAKMTAVVSYYFGSSIGSKQKTDLLK